MRILVTGGAGFIGSHLVRALLRQGDEVVVFDRVPVPHLLQDIMDSITYVQGDSASDLDLYRAVATNGIEGIFHLGALMAGVCEQNPPLAFQVNFRSTQVLLDAAVACGVKRFFFMGRPSWPGSICCAGMPTTTASTAGGSVPHGSGGPTVPTA